MHSYTCSDGAKDWKSLALGQNMQEAIMHESIDSVTPQYISIKLEFDPCDRVSPEEKQTIGTEHLMHLALIKEAIGAGLTHEPLHMMFDCLVKRLHTSTLSRSFS